MSETALDLRYNISALIIAILRKDILTPEQAFAVIADKEKPIADVEEIQELRNTGMSYREIGDIFGVDQSSIYYRLKRHNAKLEKNKKKSCS